MDNNVTCLARVKQETYTTVFIPIFEDGSKLVPVKNSGILILHSTFYDNNFIGKNYIYCGGDTEEIIKKRNKKSQPIELEMRMETSIFSQIIVFPYWIERSLGIACLNWLAKKILLCRQ